MGKASRPKKFTWFKFWLFFWFVMIPGFFAVNWVYHAVRKPAEVIGIFDSNFYKNPQATWQAHGDAFRDNATEIVSPELLAALAQTETQGNAIARTYWRWNFSSNPFHIYAPASSATGLLQITDGTFEVAKRYCIHNGRVVEDGPWHELGTCWFNSLYSRLIPSHAIEMVSAYLHLTVTKLLNKYRVSGASHAQLENLATVIHLCGASKGEAYLRRRFSFAAGERCGTHDPRSFLSRVQNLKKRFVSYSKN